MSWPREWVAKALVTDGVLFTTYPFLNLPEGKEDKGSGSALVDFPPWELAFCILEEHSSDPASKAAFFLVPGSADAPLVVEWSCIQQGARHCFI